MTDPAKAPWINPDLTFKGAVTGIGALLILVLVGLLVIGVVALFAWYFVLALIYNPIVHALFGLAIIVGIVRLVQTKMPS